MQVACIGGIVADIVVRPVDHLPSRGTLERVDYLKLHIGGCAANTGVALSRLGVAVRVFSCVGDDVAGSFVLDALRAENVDVSCVKVLCNQSTCTTIVLGHSDGERSFLHHPGALAGFSPETIDSTRLAEASLVHVAGALILPGLDGNPMASLLKQAKERGQLTSLDTVWDPTGQWMEVLAPCLPFVDFFLPSLNEAMHLIPGTDDPYLLARLLLRHGSSVVCLKMGGDGCVVARRNEEPFHVPALPTVVKDTLGAGDAFAGGMISGIVSGMDLRSSVELGSVVASHCISETGACDGLPTWTVANHSLKQWRASACE